MRSLLFTLCLFASSVAFAAETKPEAVELGTLIDGIALNAAEASRTFYIGPRLAGSTPSSTTDATSGAQVAGYKLLVLDVDFTHANNGAITLTCTGGFTRATADASLTTCTVAAGTCTLNFAGVVSTASLSADKHYTFPLGTGGNPVIKCIASHGGSPAAGDLITVKGYLLGN